MKSEPLSSQCSCIKVSFQMHRYGLTFIVSFIAPCLLPCCTIGLHWYSVFFFLFSNVLVVRHTAVVIAALDEKMSLFISLLVTVRWTGGSKD